MKELTVEEAKRQIEELQRHISAKEAEKPKGITIYKKDGSVLVQTDKQTMTEAVEANKANLRGASLRGASLREADLRGADLWGADLWGADLWGASIREADLREANLREADLRRANLWGASLREAELDSAKFYGRGGTSRLTKEQVPVFLAALGFIIED